MRFDAGFDTGALCQTAFPHNAGDAIWHEVWHEVPVSNCKKLRFAPSSRIQGTVLDVILAPFWWQKAPQNRCTKKIMIFDYFLDNFRLFLAHLGYTLWARNLSQIKNGKLRFLFKDQDCCCSPFCHIFDHFGGVCVCPLSPKRKILLELRCQNVWIHSK